MKIFLIPFAKFTKRIERITLHNTLTLLILEMYGKSPINVGIFSLG